MAPVVEAKYLSACQPEQKDNNQPPSVIQEGSIFESNSKSTQHIIRGNLFKSEDQKSVSLVQSSNRFGGSVQTSDGVAGDGNFASGTSGALNKVTQGGNTYKTNTKTEKRSVRQGNFQKGGGSVVQRGHIFMERNKVSAGQDVFQGNFIGPDKSNPRDFW